MKWTYAFVLSLGVGLAHADTFDFYPASVGYTCPSYCTGFATDSATHTVDYINVTEGGVITVNGVLESSYTFTISVDGVVYHKYSAISPFAIGDAMFTINFISHTTCVRSGRGQHCTTFRHATDGSVTLP